MPGVLCVSGLGDDTSRAQGGQQAVVGLDKGLQAGTRGDVCHCGTGGQSSSGAGRTSGTGRGDVIRKVAIILENQGNIKK